MLLVLPVVVYTLASHDESVRKFLLPLAVSFVCCAAPMSLYGIYGHVTNYWQPTLQKYVVRILWMVPVYSVTSLTELLLWLRVESGHGNAAKWCAVPRAARDCYESYTVLNFFYFMLAFLELTDGAPADVVLKHLTPSGKRRRSKRRRSGTSSYVPVPPPPSDGDHDDDVQEEENPQEQTEDATDDDSDSDSDDDERTAVRHPCPPYSCFCSAWRLDNGEFLERARYGVLLYATLMPLCALALIANAIVESQQHTSSDDDATAAAAIGDDDDVMQQVYHLLTPGNIAAFIQFNAANHAIYCLAIFYYVTHGLLAPCYPHLKFIAVKGIVFGTFFQNLGIDAVFYANPDLARAFSKGDQRQVDAALGAIQSTLMCIEMLGFALLHAKAFPVAEFPRVLRKREPPSDEEAIESTDADPVVDKRTAHISDTSRAWLAAWGDFYAEQRAERLVRPSRLIFDVSDVHRDSTALLSGLHRDVTNPILSDRSTSGFARTLARLRANRSTAALARYATSRTGSVPVV